MNETVRASFNWLHTWAGLIIGMVLFAVFWMGTLTVFDREIDRWMMPDTRIAFTGKQPSFDKLRPQIEAFAGKNVWFAMVPTDRVGAIQLGWREPSGYVSRFADPTTNQLLPDPGTQGGSGFFYPFHLDLHVRWLRIGTWLVGLAGATMLTMLVTGVVIHARIIQDFFVLRTGRKSLRTILDVHNVAGVLGLPFYFIVTFSGLLIFAPIYFPSSLQPAFHGDPTAFAREVDGIFSRPAMGRQSPQASLDLMTAEAEHRWGGDPVSFIRIRNPGDVASYVEVRRSTHNRVSSTRDVVYFDGPTGTVLQANQSGPLADLTQTIAGLHLLQFRHWSIRWLYFVSGLSGCAMIATGFLFWIEARRKRHAALGLGGMRFVEGLTIGIVPGIIAASVMFLVANRLLPMWISGRAGWEVVGFYAVWAGSFVHGWVRRSVAWRDQCWLIAGLSLTAVALNTLTTGDHPLRALARHQWGVAGVDLVLLIAAAVAVASAKSLSPHSGRAVLPAQAAAE